MSFASENPYWSASPEQSVAYAGEEARTTFIRRTYGHLTAAIALFVLIECAIFTLVPVTALDGMMRQLFAVPYSWLIVLGAFMVVSWVANSWAQSETSQGMQYAGLAVYVVAEALIMVPLLYVASFYQGAIFTAAVMTLVMFGGLTMMVFVTRADFSWLGRYLWMAGLGALGIIVVGIIFQWQLGALFSAGMVVLASGYILYYTSNVMHHYRETQYVAASLALFASVALLFWYILRLVMSFSRD